MNKWGRNTRKGGKNILSGMESIQTKKGFRLDRFQLKDQIMTDEFIILNNY